MLTNKTTTYTNLTKPRDKLVHVRIMCPLHEERFIVNALNPGSIRHQNLTPILYVK